MTGGVTLAAITAMLPLPRRLPDPRVGGDEVSQAAVTLPGLRFCGQGLVP
jgi:hypothetical protein